MQEDSVTISASEYEELLSDAQFMRCLEAAGVDNWEGYDIAKDMLKDEE